MSSRVVGHAAVRASSRPKNSSTTRRATCVEMSRSVGAWNEPTFSAREWRSAAAGTLGANGSCTCTKSKATLSSSSSIVRATSTGTEAGRRAERKGSTSPTPSTRTPSSATSPERTARREACTRSSECEGATIATSCPRCTSRSEVSRMKALTSLRSSQAYGETCAMRKAGTGPKASARPGSGRLGLGLLLLALGLDRRLDRVLGDERVGHLPRLVVGALVHAATS